MTIFKLPDLGEGLPDAEIREWHVKVGDTVKADQALVSVETAKAVVEVPSPYAGKIQKLYGKPGDIIPTGSPLVEFEGDASRNANPPSSPLKIRGESKGGYERGATVAGKLEETNEVVEEATAVGRPQKFAPAQAKAIPAVRALAKKLGIDLNRVTPTGPNGMITQDDVQRASQTLQNIGELTPLRGARRAMAEAMTRSHTEVVPVTIVDDSDIGSWSVKEDITVRLMQAVVAACKTEPTLNAWFDSQAGGLRLSKAVHLGLAVDTEEGLFVPVIKNVERLDNAALRRELDGLKVQIESRKIPQERLHGHTISLSNFGTIAGRYASPIVVPPTVAIIACGKIRDQVMAVNGKPEVRRVIPLSLTFDHRAITGGEAARFLAAMLETLQKPTA